MLQTYAKQHGIKSSRKENNIIKKNGMYEAAAMLQDTLFYTKLYFFKYKEHRLK